MLALQTLLIMAAMALCLGPIILLAKDEKKAAGKEDKQELKAEKQERKAELRGNKLVEKVRRKGDSAGAWKDGRDFPMMFQRKAKKGKG